MSNLDVLQTANTAYVPHGKVGKAVQLCTVLHVQQEQTELYFNRPTHRHIQMLISRELTTKRDCLDVIRM